MRMTEQVKQAIAKLKASGLKRSEYSVQVDVRRYTVRDSYWNGTQHVQRTRRVREYGDAIISLWTSKKRSEELVEAMAANGLDVTKYIMRDGTNGYPHVKDSGNEVGTIQTIDFRRIK